MDKHEIYVVGYPRSGNSWLSQLIGDALNSPVTGKYYAVPIGQEGLDRPGDYIVHQLHLQPEYDKIHEVAVPDAWTYVVAQRGDERVIHIVRDPRDVAVSVMYYWKKESIREALDAMACVGKTARPLGGISWMDYVKVWLDCDADVIYTSYELLHQDTATELRWILSKLGAEPINDIDEVIERQQIENKRQQIETEPESARSYHRGVQRLHLRKGIVGDWRNHFEPRHRELAHDYFWPMLKRLGYEKDEGWWR